MTVVIQKKSWAKNYSLSACENLMEKYLDAGGEAITIEEGCLGLGIVVCFGKNLKTTIIKEYYINEWNSGHTVRMYNNMPKKYAEILEQIM